ncbi:hypothetical protein E2C01_028555 [Portunus trituberculatus]|uniref:Uncharacterized protein n=1 Tax=Portunus trituberculatus TaxID=210409 RepID=A0A5B7EPB4_PORTR|nr:hypothetical protein [Portunus trituberculatus]
MATPRVQPHEDILVYYSRKRCPWRVPLCELCKGLGRPLPPSLVPGSGLTPILYANNPLPGRITPWLRALRENELCVSYKQGPWQWFGPPQRRPRQEPHEVQKCGPSDATRDKLEIMSRMWRRELSANNGPP